MTPFVRRAGQGPAVICLHSNASSSAQWRGLMEVLAPDFQVFAPDALGAGRSPPWPSDTAGLADEVALLAPVLAAAGDRVHLVGHSYGAAVAVQVALAAPGRVASMLLFEPTLFGLLEQEQPGGDAAAGIAAAAGAAAAAVARGDLPAAAEAFIDYWMGGGTWAAMPAARQASIATSMAPIGGWLRAVFASATTLADLRALTMPVALFGGAHSPAAAREVLRLLRQAWPTAESHTLDGMGHMAPVTHPDRVNPLVRGWLLRQLR